jgi:probable F420-dependent oxidoreductase
MKLGLSIANIGSYSEPSSVVSLARDAEEAGWDGVFLWDHMHGDANFTGRMCDPWVTLAAVASATERVRIGTMITPVARRRPWKLARETVTLDRLSGGRLTLGVGLGYPPDEFTLFGEDGDDRVRARKLDEGLEVLTGLWSGEKFSYDGEHYRIEDVQFVPRPVQLPRIPIWVAGMLPYRAPWRRAARYDGVFPIKGGGVEPMTVDEVRGVVADVRAHRVDGTPFEVVLSGEAERDGSQRNGPSVAEYAAAGATWWLTSITDWWGDVDVMRKRVQAGPPDA